MSGHDPLGHLHELALGTSRVLTEHVEGGPLVDPMPLHQDALGSLRDSAATEGAFQVVVFGEAPEHDVDRALQLLGISAVDDIGEDPPLGRLVDERPVLDVQDRDDRAPGLVDDPVDDRQGVAGAVADHGQGHVGALGRRQPGDLGQRRLPGDDLVAKAGHRAGHHVQVLPRPVSNQDPERDVGIRIHPDESATLPLGRSTPVSRRGLSGYSG
jgi:hypothetical protein